MVPNVLFALKFRISGLAGQSFYVVVSVALVPITVTRFAVIPPVEVITTEGHDRQMGLGDVAVFLSVPVAAGPLIPNERAVLGCDRFPDIPVAICLHTVVATILSAVGVLLFTADGMRVIVAVVIMPPMIQACTIIRAVQLITATPPRVGMFLLAASQLGCTLHPELHRVLVAVKVHVDDGGAVAGDGLTLAVISGILKAIPIVASQPINADIVARQNNRITRISVCGLRVGIRVPLIVGILDPVLDGIGSVAGSPVGVEGGVHREYIRFSVRISRLGIPAVKGESSPFRIPRCGHRAVRIGSHFGDRGRTTLAVEGDHVPVGDHRVHFNIFCYRGIGGEVCHRVAWSCAPAHQSRTGLQGDLHIVDGFAHRGSACSIHGNGVHYGGSRGVIEGDIVVVAVLGVDVIGLISRQRNPQGGDGIADGYRLVYLPIVIGIKHPTAEHSAVLLRGCRHLNGLAPLQDLGGARDQLVVCIIEPEGRHKGLAHNVDGEAVGHEGDRVRLREVGAENVVDKGHGGIPDPLQKAHVQLDVLGPHLVAVHPEGLPAVIPAILLLVHVEDRQVLGVAARKGVGLDRHRHGGLGLILAAVGVMKGDVVGRQDLHPLHLHVHRYSGDRGPRGQLAGDGDGVAAHCGGYGLLSHRLLRGLRRVDGPESGLRQDLLCLQGSGGLITSGFPGFRRLCRGPFGLIGNSGQLSRLLRHRLLISYQVDYLRGDTNDSVAALLSRPALQLQVDLLSTQKLLDLL